MLSNALTSIAGATTTFLDRWQVDFEEPPGSRFLTHHRRFFRREGKEQAKFCNYFGLGVDAQIVDHFDGMRKGAPGLFFNRLVNKVHYAWIGVWESCRRSCFDLGKVVTLTCDGKEYELDEGVEGIILGNIASYGGGAELWYHQEGDATAPSSQQDGKLDVVLCSGADHLGLVNLGLARVRKLCQATVVEISTRVKLPVHADGEPWLQPPSRIRVSARPTQAVMLKKGGEGLEREFNETLDWALGNEILTKEQKEALHKEMSRRVEQYERKQVAVKKNGSWPHLFGGLVRGV